ncbi:MAG: LysM peptidoglycan-binding domain-containing protein [Bacillota bacterium]
MKEQQTRDYRLRARKPSAILALSLPAVVLLVAGFTFTVASPRSGSVDPRYATVEVVVVSGDTLWSIARKHVSKEADLRAAVDDIMRLNDLPNSTLRPGQVLLVEVPLDQAATGTLEDLIGTAEF